MSEPAEVVPQDKPPEIPETSISESGSSVPESPASQKRKSVEQNTNSESPDSKRRPRRDRPQSKTFDKVVHTFYKRPSEQIGKEIPIIVDKYRHESVIDIEEGEEEEEGSGHDNSMHVRKKSDKISRSSRGLQYQAPTTPKASRSASSPRSGGHNPLSAPPTTKETAPDQSARTHHRARSKTTENDDWDLYEHSMSRSQRTKDTDNDPNHCCVIF